MVTKFYLNIVIVTKRKIMRLKSYLFLVVIFALAPAVVSCNMTALTANPKVNNPQSTEIDDKLPLSQTQANSKELQFICAKGYDRESQRRLPTTFAWKDGRKARVVRWKTEVFKNYSPQERCEEVSPRFQIAYHNGSLKLITNGTINNQPVICTAGKINGDCDTLLMTLRPEDDSLAILRQLIATLKGRQRGPVLHSSGDPQIYYEVDIERFMREQSTPENS